MYRTHSSGLSSLTLDKIQCNTAVWCAIILLYSILIPGKAVALMPDTSFLTDTVPQISEASNEVLPEDLVKGLDNTEALTDMLERVINFENEKLIVQRLRFKKAENALKKYHYNQFKKLLPTLADYPLYPYLQYQYLKQRISRISTKELTEFFAEYESQPVAKMLRRKLLQHSAHKGQWKRYLEFYQPQENAQLQCYYLTALLRTGQVKSAYPKIQTLWLTGKSQPHNCDYAFKHWRLAGKLTPDLVWKRFDLALANNNLKLANYLVRSLTANERKLANLWIKLHRKPEQIQKYQKRLLNNSHEKAPKIIANITKRLASRNPQLATDILFKANMGKYLEDEEHFDVLQTLAISLSRKHLSGAEFWFSHIPDQYMSDIGREWRIRTALRQSHWETVLIAIDVLSPDKLESDRWNFWRARALEELGKKNQAIKQYTALAKRRSYYGFLAADKLEQEYTITDQPHISSAGELFMLGQRGGIRRAYELFKLGRIVSARREWREETKLMPNDERVDASKLAQLWGWADQSILTMANTTYRDDMDLRFPLLFQQQVLAQSERQSIDPAWIYGVIRRESAFVKDARSPVGAVGLMQLMPSTAKRVSRYTKVKYKSTSQLTQADTNLALGTRYLRMMLKRFGGQTVLATAAYNAGEHRIDRWLPDDNTLDAERWIENIPFRETREYVKSVLAFTVIYADRLGLDGQRLKERMPSIPPRKELRSNNNI